MQPAVRRVRPGLAVLVVDDEQLVRESMRLLLAELGCVVHLADSTEAASRVAAACHVDLVLTDIVMPTMSGRELVEALQADRPHLRVLYMSGYTDDDVLRKGLHDPSIAFIQKPFTAENLATHVRKVLDAA